MQLPQLIQPIESIDALQFLMSQADVLNSVLPIYAKRGFGVVLEHHLGDLLRFAVDCALLINERDLDVIKLQDVG